jgi:hypothetical protein
VASPKPRRRRRRRVLAMPSRYASRASSHEMHESRPSVGILQTRHRISRPVGLKVGTRNRCMDPAKETRRSGWPANPTPKQTKSR